MRDHKDREKGSENLIKGGHIDHNIATCPRNLLMYTCTVIESCWNPPFMIYEMIGMFNQFMQATGLGLMQGQLATWMYSRALQER